MGSSVWDVLEYPKRISKLSVCTFCIKIEEVLYYTIYYYNLQGCARLHELPEVSICTRSPVHLLLLVNGHLRPRHIHTSQQLRDSFWQRFFSNPKYTHWLAWDYLSVVLFMTVPTILRPIAHPQLQEAKAHRLESFLAQEHSGTITNIVSDARRNATAVVRQDTQVAKPWAHFVAGGSTFVPGTAEVQSS